MKGLRSTEQTTAAHSKEFDDQAHEEAVKEVRAWTKRAAQQTLEQTIDSSFSYVEYCEAQATMNAEANTSATDGLPMLLPLSQNEIIRSSVLGLLNLCYVTRHLPYIYMAPGTNTADTKTKQTRFRYRKPSTNLALRGLAQGI